MAGANGVDLSGPLAGMWRDVYRKAAGVAEARTQELLKYHVYTYPHGAGGGGGGGNWVLLEDRVLAADGALSFTGLSQGYRDLRFLLSGRATTTGVAQEDVALQCNGDGATSAYRSTLHFAQAGGGGHGIELHASGPDFCHPDGVIGAAPAELATDAQSVGVIDLVLYDYTLTDRFKRYFALSTLSADTNQGGQTRHASGEWRSTAAVTQVSLFPVPGSWKAGTRVRVYGWADVPEGGGGGGEGTGNTTMYTQTFAPTGATNSLWFNPSESA